MYVKLYQIVLRTYKDIIAIPIVNAADHPKTVFCTGDNNPSDFTTHATNEYMLMASSNMKMKHAVKKK